jgi:hypothetical protein
MKLAALSASAVALTLAFTTPIRAMEEVNKAFVQPGRCPPNATLNTKCRKIQFATSPIATEPT